MHSTAFPKYLIFMDISGRESRKDPSEICFRIPLVTRIEISWLPSLFLPNITSSTYTSKVVPLVSNFRSVFRLLPPSKDSRPFYCKNTDEVLVKVSPQYGWISPWELAPVEVPLKLFDLDQSCRLFV
ncbi:hypothetical protein GEMRC1_011494 [Eukaryota sp. GEM-RC1]